MSTDTEREGISIDEMFPGRFVKAALLKGKDATVTISKVEPEKLLTESGGVEEKWVLGFSETDRPLILNRTNAECIGAMFGRRSAGWIGKRITIYPTRVRKGPETVDAIRVRGSPDLAADMAFELRLPRKRPQRVTLMKTVAP